MYKKTLICTLYQMETASRLQEHIHLKFTSAVPFAKLSLLDPNNPYLYCAVLYRWKIPMFIVIFMQSLVYIICIVSIEHDPD